MFRRNPRIQWRDVEGSPVLVDDVEGQLVRFSDVGARIWRELDGKKSISELVLTLSLEFDAPQDVLERDARRFLKKLSQMELVESD